MSTFINNFNNIKKQFQNNTVVILPGSFKPPHKGHWQMVMAYYNMRQVNAVHIFISNISSKVLSSKPVSKTNIKPIFKLIQKFNKTQFENSEQKQYISGIFNQLVTVVQNISLDILLQTNEKLSQITTQQFKPFIDKFNSYVQKISESTFKSIRTTQTGLQITPQISQKIFNIYINRYGVGDKVHVQKPNNGSPLIDGIQYVNNNITNSVIYLGVSKKQGDDQRWHNGIINHFDQESGNIIVPKPVSVQTMISATTIRDNLLQLKKQWFPDKLTDKDFEQIKQLLS